MLDEVIDVRVVDPTLQTLFCARCVAPLLGSLPAKEEDGDVFCARCILVVIENRRGCDE